MWIVIGVESIVKVIAIVIDAEIAEAEAEIVAAMGIRMWVDTIEIVTEIKIVDAIGAGIEKDVIEMVTEIRKEGGGNVVRIVEVEAIVTHEDDHRLRLLPSQAKIVCADAMKGSKEVQTSQ